MCGTTYRNQGYLHGLHPHDISLPAPARDVWGAVRDFGALHRRLVPGFVTACTLDGDARIVTFANGSVAREVLVDCDDARRRLVYAISNERLRHYSASVQVIAEGETSCRLVWIIDMLPNELAPYVQGQTKEAVAAMHKAFPPAAA
ncbi:polyketide cyclase [Bradyrhizobium sp. CCBAU 45321]|nr:SRPBCC family protein [Bradyrhizobium sp. CCBAU 45321]MDA9549323.1 polyketide cyclase [Bradyrhizobium sp. CCBAU 45321]